MTEVERAIETPDEDEAVSDRSPERTKGEGRPEDEGQVTEAAGEAPEEDSEAADASAAEPESEAEAEEGVAGRGKRRLPQLAAVAAIAYALDLVTKLIVVAKLEHQPPVEVIGSLLRLEVVRNRGAAFGIGEALTVVLTVIAVAVIGVIARIARKLYSTPWAVALGLLLGGALGNLTDRIFRSPGVFRGAVVDFIAPKNFAVFNLADSAIVCGGILIVVLSFRGLDPDGTVHRD